MTESKKKIDLPFKIVRSEVSGGFIDSVHTSLTGGIDIVNYHEDKYGHNDHNPLQSPVTQQWVGGKSHRHVALNDGQDDSSNRQEAWHLEFTGSGAKFYSHNKLNSPPSYWSRDGLSKRPLNITNIKQEGIYVGNYKNNYEVVQTSGRRITNNLIVDGFEATGPLTTQFITGANSYTLPELNSVTGSKSVFVERFNSPGSKEESSRGSLDREGEEISPNIPVPFRNYKIRKEFYKQLSQATPQFGGTIHNVNRNTLSRAGNTQQDNGFIVHSSPRTDIQYSWISASSPISASELGGYQAFDGTYNRAEAYTDIIFNTGSLVISGSTQEYFVDNFGINSLVKESKNVDLSTNTFSISASLSASFSEYTNSPYTFTTWTSIRNSENPVSRRMRKNNIFSVQDEPTQRDVIVQSSGRVIRTPAKPRRSSSFKSYTEPPVTYKYKPLVQRFRFVNAENPTIAQELKYTYSNNLSTFANKSLIQRLSLEESGKTFYDIVYDYYTNPESKPVNPIEQFLGMTYSETFWPREENTGLNKTRSRAFYYLNKAGFTRDGYDIQLGTQRVFWRDDEQNRKRSKNSEGGYYSSMNYLSTEETGSNFTFQDTGLLADNSNIKYKIGLTVQTGSDDGLFNSLSMIEGNTEEREISLFSGTVDKQYEGTSIITDRLNSFNSRTYVFNVGGEFNSSYNDFYEEVIDETTSYKKSLGSLYRNTSYKSLLTSLPKQRGDLPDLVIKTQDEEIFANPKLKYVAFVGGVEMNTGSFVQNSNNFNETVSSVLGFPNDTVRAIETSGSDIYIAGDFTLVGDLSADRIVKFNSSTKNFEALATGHGFNNIYDMQVSGSDIYVAGNTSPYVKKWDGSSWTSLASPGSTTTSLALFGGNIYAGTTSSGLKYYNGSSWISVSLGTSNYRIEVLEVLSGVLYIGGYNSSVFQARVSSWNGSTSTYLGDPGILRVHSLAAYGGKIYAAGSLSSGGLAEYSGGSWSLISGGPTGNYIYDMAVYGSKLYAGGEFDFSGSVTAQYDLVGGTWQEIAVPTYGTEIRDIDLSGSSLFFGGAFDYPYRNLSSFSILEQEAYYITNEELFTFSNQYFSQSFTGSDFYFSTIDNGLLNKKGEYTDKKPFFDSYEDFIEDIRASSKQYSVIPEFRISEHMKYYVSQNGSNFRAKNNSFLELDGVGDKYKSSTTEISARDQEFYKTYATSDLLKKHDTVKNENIDFAETESIEIKVNGIKKMLPYNGFYPQDRTVQLANLYEEYVDSNLHGGVYNLSYENKTVDKFIVTTQNTSSISSISVAKLGQKYYMATGKPDFGGTDDTYGGVYIYQSDVNDIETWTNTPVAHFSASSGFIYTQYGSKVQLVSASNGLNLFLYSANYPPDPFDNSNGYILHSTSSDGTSWSEPSRMQVSGTSEYISGSATNQKFGLYFDALYDSGNTSEKIIIGIGSYNEDISFTDNGSVYVVTGTMNNNSWEWSQKTSVMLGTATQNYMGYGLSLVSCSSGYQLFSCELQGDSPSSNNGNLYVVTSSNGSSWSSQVVIASGTFSSEIGLNNIKAADFDNKTYVFFSEPDLPAATNIGSVFVISSSANNTWPTTTTYSTKTRLYTTNIEEDYALNDIVSYSIEANVVDDVLYYSFANSITPPDKYPGSLIVGKTSDGTIWETLEDNNVYKKQVPSAEYGQVSAFRTVSTYVDTVDGKQFLYILSDIHDKNTDYSKVLLFGYNSFINYTLKLTDTEKYYKSAALEPFFAPGILYNTIKSGLAVDWPCATGSNTAIVPYGGNTIVNAYYPKSLEMSYFSGSNVYESAYGLIRSNIDYRIPFENILFPNEAFKSKDYRSTDLVSVTSLQTLPDNDPLVQFIKETYIYGGYEPYISPIDFADFNNLGPRRFSVPFVYRKNGSTDTGLYTLAMSNFLAETVKFFLKDQKMVTFTSSPDYKWKQFNSDKTYYMDVVVEKSPELVMIEGYHGDKHPTGSNGEKMDGRYFGYPVNKTDKALWGGAEFSEEEKRLIHNDPAYAPYTPPYFEGEARLRISFKPTGTSRSYSLQEIFDEAVVENIFNNVANGATTGSDAYVNKMPIGSSMDVFGSAQATEVTIDEITGKQTVKELTDTQNWIISPKMETPVLDFSSQSLESYENSYSKTGGFGRGIWSGYGSIPTTGKGLKVRLEYPFTTINSPLTASLLDQVGFKAEEKNVGVIADNKEISEAIVVIPYLENNNPIYGSTKNKTGFEFIRIERENFDFQKQNIEQGLPAVPAGSREGIAEDIQKTSISEMITKMKEYVIPPEMNFLQYSDINPFVVYIFEFKHVLSQQDLADIWQGLMPEISRTAENEQISIKHPSGPYEFFEGKKVPDNLRWMVFKVKKKAEINYFNITATTKDDSRFNFNKIIGREEGTDIYSYNWPYDFFSLVEMAKVELKIDYKSKETQ